jgi:hypothetical protein
MLTVAEHAAGAEILPPPRVLRFPQSVSTSDSEQSASAPY